MLRIVLLTLSLTLSLAASAFVVETPTTPTTAPTFQQIDKEELASTLGRDLTFKERLAVNTFNKRNLRALRKANKRTLKGLPPVQSNNGSNGWAIAGFACGVVGLLFVGGLLLGPCAIVFSVLGMKKSRQEGAPLKGLAIAGLVCGILASFIWLIILIAAASTL